MAKGILSKQLTQGSQPNSWKTVNARRCGVLRWTVLACAVAAVPTEALCGTQRQNAELKTEIAEFSEPNQKQQANLSPLAKAPDWRGLDQFQKSIDRESFLHLLDTIYAPKTAWSKTVAVSSNFALIKTRHGSPRYRLDFASETNQPEKTFNSRLAAKTSVSSLTPLAGLEVAIDSGHIGGEWSKLEERWFQFGNGKPVVEGDMTMLVAIQLREELQKLGAAVDLIRSQSTPCTSLRPHDLENVARESLAKQGVNSSPQRLRKETERLFYRTAEIHARAERVNNELRPDFVLALHFNAEPWGNPEKPTLVATNHLHVLVTGAFTEDELDFEDQRFRMLTKLLSQNLEKESSLAISLAQSLAEETGLPAYKYPPTAAAVPISGSDYVWARNLLANRLYDCPVIYLEPYVMNSRDVYERVQAGDYEGERKVNGVLRPSIYREYVDGVVKGLIRHYKGEPSVLPCAGGQVF